MSLLILSILCAKVLVLFSIRRGSNKTWLRKLIREERKKSYGDRSITHASHQDALAIIVAIMSSSLGLAFLGCEVATEQPQMPCQTRSLSYDWTVAASWWSTMPPEHEQPSWLAWSLTARFHRPITPEFLSMPLSPSHWHLNLRRPLVLWPDRACNFRKLVRATRFMYIEEFPRFVRGVVCLFMSRSPGGRFRSDCLLAYQANQTS